jgi:hypothetical protein
VFVGLFVAGVGLITMGIGWFVFRGYLFAQHCSFGFVATLMGALLLFVGLFVAGTSRDSRPCPHSSIIRIGLWTDKMYHCHPLFRCRDCGTEVYVGWDGKEAM